MNEIVVLSGAEQDLIGHYCRLEELREGAGTAFDHAINEQLFLLANHPRLGPPYAMLPSYRRRVVLAWDVAIYYRISGNRVAINAVLHMRQDPATILALLRSRLPR